MCFKIGILRGCKLIKKIKIINFSYLCYNTSVLAIRNYAVFEQEYLWKYLSLDKFVSILENNGLYFTTIKNLKRNIEPDECCILDYHLTYHNVKMNELQNEIILMEKNIIGENNIVNNDYKICNTIRQTKYHYERLEKLKKDFLNTYNGMIQNIFVCSFTNDLAENYTLWKIYPTDLNGNQ